MDFVRFGVVIGPQGQEVPAEIYAGGNKLYAVPSGEGPQPIAWDRRLQAYTPVETKSPRK